MLLDYNNKLEDYNKEIEKAEADVNNPIVPQFMTDDMVEDIESQINSSTFKNKSYKEREAIINSLYSSYGLKEGDKKIEKEFFDYISQRTLFNADGTPSIFALQNKADKTRQELNKVMLLQEQNIKEAKDRAKEEGKEEKLRYSSILSNLSQVGIMRITPWTYVYQILTCLSLVFFSENAPFAGKKRKGRNF
jgi:hypothetical protein